MIASCLERRATAKPWSSGRAASEDHTEEVLKQGGYQPKPAGGSCEYQSVQPATESLLIFFGHSCCGAGPDRPGPDRPGLLE